MKSSVKNKIKYIAFIVMMNLFSLQLIAQNKMIFPRPFAFAVDDLGWNIGNDTGDLDNQGPYRIGIDRKMDLNDYKVIVEVGKNVGVRIQSLFVLAEMDRQNILKNYPSTTWQGKNWDNSKNIGQEQIDIMDFVKDNAAYMEFGLHGVGHEFWVDGQKKRAEWYCIEDNHPWNKKTLEQHIQCFKDIMAQYGISKENGQRFPESFVPCAYGYHWNPDGKFSTGKLMSENGVKYVNTLFETIPELNPPKGNNGGGFDNGVIVVNRINYGNEWWKQDALPTVPLEKQESDIIESHWSNWLAQDNFLQDETTQKFIDYYMMVQKSTNRYCAKNTEQFYSQWLYKKYTKVKQKSENVVEIDNTKMPNEAYKHDILGVMVLKVPIMPQEHITYATLNGSQIPAYFEQSGWAFLYLPVLKQQTYTLKYKIGKQTMPFYVYNDGTYNVYSIKKTNKNMLIDLKMYGTQTVKIKCDSSPVNIKSKNKNLKILSYKFDDLNKILSVKIRGIDIQGERAKIELSF